jgi:hypothetical protein
MFWACFWEMTEMTDPKYHEYLDVDERYFPCIDDAAIDAGAPWENTYPHDTFLVMLTSMERALARQNNGKTLWIEGAYGTGKSQCALALRRILEATEDELRAYWDRYEPLKKKTDLLEKLIGHKKKGIVVAHRYASGGIMSARDLFFAIQESVKVALIRQNISYLGENTLKESVIAWLEDADHKLMFNSLLQNPNKEWRALFSQSTTDEILNLLHKTGEVKSLIDNIFHLADKEGITALTIDSDRLIAWLTDIIDENKIRIVFIWDEFSDYFKNNRESLSEFQKVAALVQTKPFYFIVVTHEPQQLYIADNDRGNQSKVSDRFISIPIALPDNIAFHLIGHAFNVKPSAKPDWTNISDDLNDRVKTSRSEVMKVAKINDQQVIKDIMPIHPVAALLLKNIASAFKSNQRSMFDFIKSTNMGDTKAFQWFIENKGPYDDHLLLTVDMLWNFFYEKGRENLTPDIRLILDTFPQQQNLSEDESAVLKAILIMQAIDHRLGGTIDLFKTTEQNLSYVFEGISNLETTIAPNLAKTLKDNGILVSNPIGGGRYVYAAAVLAGDQTKIDNHKKKLRQTSTTAELADQGGLCTVLSLSPALRLRFESEPHSGKITPVTLSDFTRTINLLRDKATSWKFHAVIAFAKDESESATFRKTLRTAVADKQYENIVFIDALSTPLGQEAFEQYVDYAAMALYYQGSQNNPSRESTDKANRVLSQDWKTRIYNGQFVVYTYANQEGDKLGNGQGVASVLQTIVTNKFPFVFDFTKGLTENQLKATPSIKQSAKSGITQATSGVVLGLEKTVLPSVWKSDNYWENSTTAALPISKIKVEVDKRIEKAFSIDGQISIGEIYDFLVDSFGFAPCNLSAFIAGFLLKEYGNETFRYSDSSGGHEPMTQNKLAEMLSNYITKPANPTYIVKMTPDEMAFYKLTEKSWRINPNSCSSAAQAAKAVTTKMRDLKLPVWCLEEVDTYGIFDVIQRYIELVQNEGNEAHKKAVEIGAIASVNPSLADNLFDLLTNEKCQEGMRKYLLSFEDGMVMDLAKSIGAENNVLSDILRLFSVKYSCFWDKQMSEDEIRKLITEYGIVKESNSILSTTAHSLHEAYGKWRERLNFIGISCEALRSEYPTLAKIFDMLLKICKDEDILPDQLKIAHAEFVERGKEIRELLNDDRRVFTEVYKAYLEDLSPDDIAAVKANIGTGFFKIPKTDSNTKVKEAAEKFRKNLLKSQLLSLWKDKTGTKTPRDWSKRFRTPIQCLVPTAEYDSAKKAFDTLNSNLGTDSEIKNALSFLESTTIFTALSDEKKRNSAFNRDIVGIYSTLLTDIEKVRDALDQLPSDVYDWLGNRAVKVKVEELAKAEYNAGGSDKVLLKIDKMDDSQLKQYLKRLVKDSITVGVEILADGG